MNNFSKRLADLNRALVAASKAKSPAAVSAENAPTATQPNAPPLTFAQFFDLASKDEDKVNPLSCVPATALPGYDSKTDHFNEEPVIINSLNSVENVTTAGGVMLKSIRNMKGDFMNDKKVCIAKGGSGRCQQSPKAEAAQNSIMAFFYKYLQPLGWMLKTAQSFPPDPEHPFHASMADALQCSMFGIEKGSSHHGVERHLFGSVRFQMTGTRQFLCTRFDELYMFMRHRKVKEVELGKHHDGKPIEGYEIETVSTYFRFMTAELLNEYMCKYSVFTGTIPPNDLFFLPPHYIYIEAVMQDDHVFGL